MGRTVLTILAILITLGSTLTIASAHDPGTLTVIVRSGEHSIDSVSVVVGNTVQYKNEDTRENTTHFIGFDGNGDGDFTDIGEFGSGPINGTCDWENDSDCRVAWILMINSTDYIGNYTLIDYTNTNETHYVNLNIQADAHGDEAEGNHKEGHDDDNSTSEETSEDLSMEEWLQRGGAFFLLTAAFLAISVLAHPKKKKSN
jgi:hypothetical protein